jgi:hypothetical protein
VVLEAMAAGLPVIAAAWGGPTDYLDESCGILIEPSDRESFIGEFAVAMERLAGSFELRKQLGEAGRRRAAEFYDWQKKGEQILSIYERAAKSGATSAAGEPRAFAVTSSQSRKEQEEKQPAKRTPPRFRVPAAAGLSATDRSSD